MEIVDGQRDDMWLLELLSSGQQLAIDAANLFQDFAGNFVIGQE